MKPWHKVVLAVVVVVVLVIIAIPFFLNANTFRPMLETQLSQALNRQVKLGALHLSLFTGSLVADNVTIADDPAFSTSPFLEANSLHIGVEMMPLLLHRQVQVTRFAADQPQVHLIHNAKGVWNYSSIGRTSASSTQNAQQPSVLPNLTVGKLTVTGGNIMVTDVPPTGKPLVYSNVDLSVDNFSFAQQFPFTLTASLPGGGSLDLSGKAGPVSQADTSDTPFEANVTLKHFDPVQAGVVDASQGFSMLADITAHATSDGRTLSSNGTANLQNLKLVRNGAPAPRPVNVTYTASENFDSRTGQVQDLAVKTGGVAAHATGTFQLMPQQTVLNMRFAGNALPINEIEALLPAFGVRLPSGSALQGGTLTTTLTITGPAGAPTINGPVDVENTRLAGFNLGSKLGGLAALGGVQTGNMTDIRSFRTNLNATTAGVRAQNIAALVPALGSATGEGTVSAAGALNFRLNVKLNTKNGAGGTAMGVLSALNGAIGQTAKAATSSGIPLTITGTTSDPHFGTNIGSLAGSVLNGKANPARDLQKQNPGQVLKNLLGGH